MIDPIKIENALARINDQRQEIRSDKLKKIIADVEENIKTNPLGVDKEIQKLSHIYADAPEDKQALFAEIKRMLEEAIAEHTHILLDDAKELISHPS